MLVLVGRETERERCDAKRQRTQQAATAGESQQNTYSKKAGMSPSGREEGPPETRGDAGDNDAETEQRRTLTALNP